MCKCESHAPPEGRAAEHDRLYATDQAGEFLAVFAPTPDPQGRSSSLRSALQASLRSLRARIDEDGQSQHGTELGVAAHAFRCAQVHRRVESCAVRVQNQPP